MGEQKDAFFVRLTKSPAFRSLMLFSIFRAIYGTGILIVTYFIATSDNAPIWASIVFLLFSMIFSRILFSFIKKKWQKDGMDTESMRPTTAL